MSPAENAIITLTDDQTPSFVVQTPRGETIPKTACETVDQLAAFYAASKEGEVRETMLDVSGLSATALQKVLTVAQNAAAEDNSEIAKELDRIGTRTCIDLLQRITALDRYATAIPVDLDTKNFPTAKLNIRELQRSDDGSILSIYLHIVADQNDTDRSTTLILLTSDGNQKRFPVSTGQQVAPVRLAWEKSEPSLEDKLTTPEIIRLLETHLATLQEKQ